VAEGESKEEPFIHGIRIDTEKAKNGEGKEGERTVDSLHWSVGCT
jgi:hypothetical protein